MVSIEPNNFLLREDEELGDEERLGEARARADQDSPLSVDSLSGIYLGFSEKVKKEKEGVGQEGNYIVEDDLKIEDDETMVTECLGPKQPEKISRSHVLAHFFQRPKRRSKVQIVKEEGEEREEKEEATSCFRLFRRTLNIADYEG